MYLILTLKMVRNIIIIEEVSVTLDALEVNMVFNIKPLLQMLDSLFKIIFNTLVINTFI